MSDPPASAVPIRIRNLLKSFGHITAVDGIDLTVTEGSVYGFLGPNGAGKTTTLRMILGLIRPTSGTAELFGRDPVRDGVVSLDGVAGFVEAPTFYPYLSGRRNLHLLADLDRGGGHDRVEETLAVVELSHRGDDKVGGYSQGMKQRLGLAAALLRQPKLLLLDEPTNGLDPGGMRDMRRLIGDLAGDGLTVLLSSHLMGEVEQLCTELAIIARAASGSPAPSRRCGTVTHIPTTGCGSPILLALPLPLPAPACARSASLQVRAGSFWCERNQRQLPA